MHAAYGMRPGQEHRICNKNVNIARKNEAVWNHLALYLYDL